MCTKAKCYATSCPAAEAVDLVQSSEVLVIIAFGLTKKIFFPPRMWQQRRKGLHKSVITNEITKLHFKWSNVVTDGFNILNCQSAAVKAFIFSPNWKAKYTPTG